MTLRRTLLALAAAVLFAPLASGARLSWVQRGPAAADVRRLAVVPGTNTVFAATNGGLYRSDDAGDSWSRVPALPVEVTQDVAVDPFDPERIFVAGWTGVYASSDGGRRWKRALPEPQGTLVQFDPDTPSVMYVRVAGRGSLRSYDGGVSWTPFVMYGLRLFFDGSGTMYAGNASGSIYVSRDDGATWKEMKLNAGSVGRIFSGAGAVWADALRGLYKSTDGGETWTTEARPDPMAILRAGVEDPATRTLYVATHEHGVFRRAAGDSGWTSLGAADIVGMDVMALLGSPGNPLLLVGTEGRGVWRSVGAGSTWTEPRVPINTSVVTALALDPKDASAMFAGTSGGEVFRMSKDGRTLRRSTFDGWSSVVDLVVTDTTILAATFIHGVFRSTDGGATWTKPGPIYPTFIWRLVADPRDPRRLAAATRYGVYVSTDSGDTWKISHDLLRVTSVMFQPSDGSLLIAMRDGIHDSNDSGATWQKVSSGPGQYDHTVDRFFVAPDGTIFAGTPSEGIWSSADRGRTWSLVDGAIDNVRSFAVADDASRTIYAASLSEAVYRSTDGGRRWEVFAALSGLSAFAVIAEPQPSARIWLATTAGVLDCGVNRRRAVRH